MFSPMTSKSSVSELLYVGKSLKIRSERNHWLQRALYKNKKYLLINISISEIQQSLML